MMFRKGGMLSYIWILWMNNMFYVKNAYKTYRE